MKPRDEPITPRTDVDIGDEGSSVRPRVDAGRRERSASGTYPAAPASERVTDLLRIASALLADLPPSHARAHLLRIAIMRRDAALLEALVKELSGRR
jgi:hypothetical protein